jgi:FKBP-type peptidyl-prolyl cis-trans isomerase FkpA/FKBP-type peptidyl-prolyl cis-trans isomerase FklB
MKSFPGGEANLVAFSEAFMNSLFDDDDALVMSLQEAQAFAQSYFMEITVKEAEAAREEEIRFMAENKTQEGVITTESGLQYKIITQGNGKIPVTEDVVKVHYTGILLDGTIFDSDERRGEPLIIQVSNLISGWNELLQLMPVGSKYIAWIPSELGYGSQGAPPVLKPNTTLIFEVELLAIEENGEN